MADLTNTYSGVIEYFDPKADSGVLNPSTLSWFGTGGSNFWLEEMPFWADLATINRGSAETIAAVKIPYTAGQDREQWLNDRIKAINNRVTFIAERTKQLLDALKANGSSAYDGLMKGFTTALSAVPVVGPVISYFSQKNQTAVAVQQLQLQTLIQSYTADLSELASMKTLLQKELVTIDPTKYDAPTAWPLWYYFVGAGILLLLFFWYRKNHLKRRKR